MKAMPSATCRGQHIIRQARSVWRVWAWKASWLISHLCNIHVCWVGEQKDDPSREFTTSPGQFLVPSTTYSTRVNSCVCFTSWHLKLQPGLRAGRPAGYCRQEFNQSPILAGRPPGELILRVMNDAIYVWRLISKGAVQINWWFPQNSLPTVITHLCHLFVCVGLHMQPQSLQFAGSAVHISGLRIWHAGLNGGLVRSVRFTYAWDVYFIHVYCSRDFALRDLNASLLSIPSIWLSHKSI